MDLCCAIHELNHGGQITGTAEQLSRPCRCTVAQFIDAAAELRQTTTADITDRNGVYTIVSRRIKRDAKLRKVRREAANARWHPTDNPKVREVAHAKPDPNALQFPEDDNAIEDRFRGKEGTGEPSGAPCSVDDCVNQAGFIGLPPVEAEKFWNHYASTGWRVSGAAVTNWKALLTKWRIQWEATRHQMPAEVVPKKESIWEKTKRVDLITEEIEQMRTRGGSDGNGGYRIIEADKDRYSKLIAERKKLKTEIKGVA